MFATASTEALGHRKRRLAVPEAPIRVGAQPGHGSCSHLSLVRAQATGWTVGYTSSPGRNPETYSRYVWPGTAEVGPLTVR